MSQTLSGIIDAAGPVTAPSRTPDSPRDARIQTRRARCPRRHPARFFHAKTAPGAEKCRDEAAHRWSALHTIREFSSRSVPRRRGRAASGGPAQPRTLAPHASPPVAAPRVRAERGRSGHALSLNLALRAIPTQAVRASSSEYSRPGSGRSAPPQKPGGHLIEKGSQRLSPSRTLHNPNVFSSQSSLHYEPATSSGDKFERIAHDRPDARGRAGGRCAHAVLPQSTWTSRGAPFLWEGMKNVYDAFSYPLSCAYRASRRIYRDRMRAVRADRRVQ